MTKQEILEEYKDKDPNQLGIISIQKQLDGMTKSGCYVLFVLNETKKRLQSIAIDLTL
jgi:hypothetical protein